MTTNATTPTYATVIHVWSRNGHTPLTNRGGAYCDLLATITVEVATPFEAHRATVDVIRATEHGAYGHFSISEHPNQNLRDGFVSLPVPTLIADKLVGAYRAAIDESRNRGLAIIARA